MGQFTVAEKTLGGVTLLLVPVEGMENRPEREQQIIMDELQNRANMAGLIGTLVPVWPDGPKGMKFRAPDELHTLVGGLSLDWVLSNLNRTVRWPD